MPDLPSGYAVTMADERTEQPHPGATGHPEEKDSEQRVEPEVDEAEGEDAGEQSAQADQESKHSHPTSDAPGNY